MNLRTPIAAKVMIHAIKTGTDGVSRMVHLETLEIPAGQMVTLSPGVMHLMLMGLASKLEEGSSFPLSLTFEKAGENSVDVQIPGVAATGPTGTGQ